MNPLKKALLLLGLIASAPFAISAHAASSERHYDCSKPGNANKSACKGSSSVAPAAKSATRTKTRTSAVTTKTATRQYDCTKAGNKNKTVCRTAAAQTSSGKTAGAVKTTKTTKTTTATTTDCSKWYNKARAACRTTTSNAPAHTTVAPAPKPAAAGNVSNSGVNSNPAGATAQCKDGTYSHAAHHSGACSRHGGVAKWLP